MDRWTRGSLWAAMICALAALAHTAPAAADTTPLQIQNRSTDRYFTPNGDGHEDTGKVTYGLTQAATVDVTIMDGGGATVRTVLNHVTQPQNWNNDAFEWDGLDASGNPAPAGAYTYRIRAEATDGTVVTADGQIGIERTPFGQITEPAAGASLTGRIPVRFVPAPAPTRRISDVEFGAQSAINLDTRWVYAGPDGSYAGDLDSSHMRNGDNRVTALVEWYDAFNQFHFDSVATPVTVTNAPSFTAPSHDEAFSPNGDGIDDGTTTIFALLNGAADIRIRVLDADGHPVRTLLDDHEESRVEVRWDGNDADGNRVPDGDYDIEIAATNAAGTTTTERSVTVDTQPLGAFITPAQGHVLTGTETFSFAPRPGVTVDWIDYRGQCAGWNGPADCYLATAMSAGLDGTWAATGDTSTLIDGDHTLTAEVRFRDPYGNAKTWPVTIPVRVSNPVRLRWPTIDTYFTPDGDGQEDTTDVTFNSSRHSTLDVEISSEGGAVVRHMHGIDAPDPQPRFTWDGRDDDGNVVDDGAYTWVATATDDDGGTGTISGHLGVITEQPGTLTAPAAGATLAGPFDLTFAPTDGFQISGVDFYRCDDGDYACYIAGSQTPAADGTFTAAADEENRPQGEWQISAHAVWTDPLGATHTYRTPPVSVTVADPLAVSVDDDQNAWFIPASEETFDSWYRINRDAHVSAAIVDAQDHVVRTLRDEDEAGGSEDLVSWDGLGDGHLVTVDPADCPPTEDPEEVPDCDHWVDGDPVPTGDYRLRVHAVSGDEQKTVTQPVHLERRPAGVLVTPADGDTISRNQAFVVRGTDEYPQSVIWVDLCVTDDNGADACDRVYPDTDGLFRTGLDTSGLANGPADLTYDVAFGEDWGELGWHATHWWHGHAGVTISDVAPDVSLTAEPAKGDAPLASTLTLHATDSAGPLDYTVDYGDGTPTGTGTIAAPYDAVPLAHTYQDAGIYHAHVIVSDQDGNTAQRTIEIVVTAPPVPVPTTGTLVMQAATAPADDGGRFNVSVDGLRKTPGAQTVSAGLHTVAVSAGRATSFANYDASIACVDGAGTTVANVAHSASLTVNVPGGTTVTCTATATRLTAAIEVRKTGEGDGTVTSTPAGLDCGPTCFAQVPRGGAVRLTAVPAAGSVFLGWDAAECPGTGDCTLTMDTGRGVHAQFEKVGPKALAGDDLRGEAETPIAFDGSASRPVGAVESYRWEFGDGDTSDQARASHTYAHAGHYTATLTVTADGETSTDSVNVDVDEHDDGRGLRVSVYDDALDVPGADVVVTEADGDRIQGRTNSNGVARLRGVSDGPHVVYVNADGYVPEVAHADVEDGSGSVSVGLERGALATAEVESHELSESEIAAAGIDAEDPANQQVYSSSVDLCFSAGGDCKSVSGYFGWGSDGAWWGGGGGGGGTGPDACACVTFPPDSGSPGLEVQGHPVWIDGTPVMVWMGIPIGGGFTKQFFDVKLLVTNLAPPQVKFTGGSATLALPAGMSLAPTAAAQSLTLDVDDIPGGTSRGVSWVVRGDAAGSYSPTVSYQATLQPFDTPVTLSAQTKQPIKVWGASDALRVVVDADSKATPNEPYRVRLGLRNVSAEAHAADATTVYNGQITIGEHDGWIFQPRQSRTFSVPTIGPGQTHWTDDVILIPERGGLLDVKSSVVAGAAGDQAGGSGGVVEHDPTRALGFEGYTDGTLRWKPAPDATRYEVYSVPAEGEDVFPTEQFPGAPVAQSLGTEVKIPGGGGPDKWYAISTIHSDGTREMLHPIVQATLPPDRDDDGVPDDVDNCPDVKNPGQADADSDGKGDACDSHDDRPQHHDDNPTESDDDAGEPDPDPNCDGEHRVKVGPVEAVASCFKRAGAHKWKSSARVRLGGLDIEPSGSADITVDTEDWEISTNGSVEVKAGSLTLWRGRIDWTLKAAKTFKVAQGAKLKGLPIKGEATIQLVSGGVKLDANAKLPDTFGGVTGGIELRLTNETGLRLDNLEIKIPGFEIKGKLGVQNVTLSYQRDGTDDELGTWAGGATILIPRAGLTRTGLTGHVVVKGDYVQELSGGVDGLNVMLGEGFFLQRLRALLQTVPLAFGGGAGISFGPQVMGNEAGSLDGDLKLTLEGPDSYAATGELQIAEVTIATGHVTYATSGKLDFGGSFKWEKMGVGVDAGVEGWVDGIRAFNAGGHADVKLPGGGFGGEAVLSNKGMAGCRRGWGPDVGFGYGWGSSAPHIFASSCDVGPWSASASIARAAAATDRAAIPAQLPVATFAIRGAGAPPRVTLTGPDGLTITTPAGGAMLSTDRVLLFQNPADDTTYVAVKAPAGGDWKIDELPGSAPVTSIRHANGLPQPKVTGKVSRSGAKRILRYRVRRIPGQAVQFAERIPGGRVRVLGAAHGSHGRLTIKPQPGARGKRRVFAQVSQYGLPRDELAVASYTPPKSASGRVQGLRLTTRKGKLKATWKRVSGAKAYRVAVRVSDGRRLLYLDVRKRSLTIPRVLRGMRATVQVRADGLLGGTPRDTTRSIKVKR